MMKSSRFEKDKKIEGNIIKDVRNLFRLKKEIDDTTVKDIKNIFKLTKEKEANKNRIIKDIRNLFEHEEEGYYKPVSVSKSCGNNYIEYESNGERNKTISVASYLNKIRSYLKHITNNLKNSDTWKIQLTIAINFISSKDNDKEQVMHSKSDNIEIMINDKVYEFIEKPFESLLNR